MLKLAVFFTNVTGHILCGLFYKFTENFTRFKVMSAFVGALQVLIVVFKDCNELIKEFIQAAISSLTVRANPSPNT